MKDSSISVILPAYNEESNIANTVKACVEYFTKKGYDFEIIVVDDCSIDQTQSIVEGLKKNFPFLHLVVHKENQGAGSALRSGFEAAKKEDIFYMDSDGQFSIDDFDKLLPFSKSHDAVIGYRLNRADPMIRTFNAWLYKFFLRIFFGLKFKDPDCGFKFFKKQHYLNVKPIQSNGAFFIAELLISFQRQGLKIKEVAVRHFKRSSGRQTGAKLSVITKMFYEAAKYKIYR